MEEKKYKLLICVIPIGFPPIPLNMNLAKDKQMLKMFFPCEDWKDSIEVIAKSYIRLVMHMDTICIAYPQIFIPLACFVSISQVIAWIA